MRGLLRAVVVRDFVDVHRNTATFEEDDVGEYNHGYVNSAAHLEKHSHATNLYDTGLYELINDPREDSDA